MQFALMIYHAPEEFAMRKNDYSDPHLGAWRAYYKALVEAGVYVGANALEVPETGTTVRLKEGKRRVQDGPYAETKEQLHYCRLNNNLLLIDDTNLRRTRFASGPDAES